MFNSCTKIYLVMLRLSSMIMLVTVFGSPLPAVAEGMQGITKDANELSKEMVNSVGKNWLINTYVNVIEKEGDAAFWSLTMYGAMTKLFVPLYSFQWTPL